jgi:hypothetical protein
MLRGRKEGGDGARDGRCEGRRATEKEDGAEEG